MDDSDAIRSSSNIFNINNFLHNPIMKRYTANAFQEVEEMEKNFQKIYQSGIKYLVEIPYMTKIKETS